jgi:hypothetical protein
MTADSPQLHAARHVGLQIEYSLLERTVERELIPVAKDQQMTMLAWSPLRNGQLTGKYLPENSSSAESKEGRMNSEMTKGFGALDGSTHAVIREAVAIGKELGCGERDHIASDSRGEILQFMPLASSRIGASAPASADWRILSRSRWRRTSKKTRVRRQLLNSICPRSNQCEGEGSIPVEDGIVSICDACGGRNRHSLEFQARPGRRDDIHATASARSLLSWPARCRDPRANEVEFLPGINNAGFQAELFHATTGWL